jgi:hypothetical protein
MAQLTAAESIPLTAKEIKQFGAKAGPCLTILLPVNAPGGPKRALKNRLKSAAQRADQELGKRMVVTTVIRKIVDPIRSFVDHVEGESRGATLALFASEEGIHPFWLTEPMHEIVVAADNFFIRPFLKSIEGEREFYLLALDQKNVRLLKCTEHSSEEIDLGPGIPRSVEEHAAIDKPDHVLDNRVTGGQSAGAKGVMFTTRTDAEYSDEYLMHFFKAVSRGISEHLRGQERTPLVVCGVEYELALFKRVNMWEKTCPEGVRGAPNSLKGGEMHGRALECLEKMDAAELENILVQHNRQAGGLATAGVNDLVKAAYDGRVLRLFVAENAQALGNFDDASHRARTHQVARAGDEDLINAAAVQTILHSGWVHVLPQARVPGNRPMAAIMRY